MPDQSTIDSYKSRIIKTVMQEGFSQNFGKIIAAQAEHETGRFSSNPFKQNNNGYGMKVPSVRKSPYIIGAGTAAPANEGLTPYAKYKNLEDSTRDVLHWLQYNKADFNQLQTPEAYAAFLKSKNYYGPTAEFYGRQIRIFYDKMKNFIVTNPGKTGLLLAGIALIAIGGYLYLKRKAG